jgi:hypothetical protein
MKTTNTLKKLLNTQIPQNPKTTRFYSKFPLGSIGRPIVQKLHSAIITSKAAKGMLVATGHFTQEALIMQRN